MENKKEKMNYFKVIINFFKKLFRSKKKEKVMTTPILCGDLIIS